MTQLHQSTALVVVDYANVNAGRFDAEQPEAAALRLRLFVESVASRSGAARILVRMYGGWMQDGLVQSNAASRALYTAENADPFPLHAGGLIQHGRIELATALLSVPEHELPDTFRKRAAIPRVRLLNRGPPLNCVVSPENCPAVAINKFTKGARKQCPTEACTVTSGEAFVRVEQKMVDTHMAADILFAGASPDYGYVATVSGDSDVVPPLLQAARTCPGDLALAPVSEKIPDLLIELLSREGVEILEVETP